MGDRIAVRGALAGPPGRVRPARRSAPVRPAPPVRLTRRGRVVVVVAVALVLLVGLWVSARHGARATSGGARAAAVPVSESVVVGSHDTLWDIAVRTRPGVDPRVTVQR